MHTNMTKLKLLSCSLGVILSAVQAGATLTGNTLWVDAVNGNNSTAARGDSAKPFLTCAAAQSAAVSGDTIVVRPGSYSASNLGKNGVNWELETGVKLLPGPGNYAFRDLGGTMSFNISGNGELIGGGLFFFQSIGSSVRAHLLRAIGGTGGTVMYFNPGTTANISILDDVSGDMVFLHTTTTLRCKRILSSTTLVAGQGDGYQTLVAISADEAVNFGLYQDISNWGAGGKTDLYIKRIKGPNTASGYSAGYAVWLNDGNLAVHNAEVRNGSANKLVMNESTASRLVLDNCTIIGSVGTACCVEGPSDLWIVGTLTSNLPRCNTGFGIRWQGRFVYDPDVVY